MSELSGASRVHQSVATQTGSAAILALVTAIDAVTALLPDAGALLVPPVDSVANVDWGDTGGNKDDAASSAAGASRVALLRQILLSIGGNGNSHLPLFTGSIWYVDAAQPDDTGDGLSPETAKETIGAGIGLMAAGDRLKVKAGVYDENGLDLNLDGMELICEAGAILVDTTPGTVLTVSAIGCVVDGAHFVQAGAAGLQITGIGTIVKNCIAVNCTIGFDIDEHSTQVFNCVSAAHTVTGFDVGERNTVLRECFAPGTGAATRGFYLSDAAVTRSLLDQCHSVGNATAGFEAVAETTNNTMAFSTSGGGDGPTVDSGIFNNWPGYIDQLATEQHEEIFPLSDGEGGAGDPVNISNSTTDGGGGVRQDQDYWGDVAIVIPPDEIVARWSSLGIYLHAVTAADVQQWEIFFTYENMVSAQNGGNDWDENEVDFTVVDGSLFQNDDYVWVTGADREAGEIMLVDGAPAGNVVTLARETTADAEAGLRYDYDATGVNNRIYLVKRPAQVLYHSTQGDYSASGAREHARYDWHAAKQLGPNAAMLMRMLNATDGGASSFDVRAIYED